jgi:hypothetical protein
MVSKSKPCLENRTHLFILTEVVEYPKEAETISGTRSAGRGLDSVSVKNLIDGGAWNTTNSPLPHAVDYKTLFNCKYHIICNVYDDIYLQKIRRYIHNIKNNIKRDQIIRVNAHFSNFII